MVHKVIPLETWITPRRAIAKEHDIDKNVITICEADYEWLKEQEKELGRKIFKDVSEPKKSKKETFKLSDKSEIGEAFPTIEGEEVK